jgi:hypothetical protein
VFKGDCDKEEAQHMRIDRDVAPVEEPAVDEVLRYLQEVLASAPQLTHDQQDRLRVYLCQDLSDAERSTAA